MIVLDIEVDGSISTLESHKICVEIEKQIRRGIENVFDTVIHLEPKGYRHEEEVYGISPTDLEDR